MNTDDDIQTPEVGTELRSPYKRKVRIIEVRLYYHLFNRLATDVSIPTKALETAFQPCFYSKKQNLRNSDVSTNYSFFLTENFLRDLLIGNSFLAANLKVWKPGGKNFGAKQPEMEHWAERTGVYF